jgi:hypothetical protein
MYQGKGVCFPHRQSKRNGVRLEPALQGRKLSKALASWLTSVEGRRPAAYVTTPKKVALGVEAIALACEPKTTTK